MPKILVPCMTTVEFSFTPQPLILSSEPRDSVTTRIPKDNHLNNKTFKLKMFNVIWVISNGLLPIRKIWLVTCKIKNGQVNLLDKMVWVSTWIKVRSKKTISEGLIKIKWTIGRIKIKVDFNLNLITTPMMIMPSVTVFLVETLKIHQIKKVKKNKKTLILQRS